MKIKIILTVLIVFALTGCYDYKELNNISIVTSMSIDKFDNNYLVGFLEPNLGDNDEKGQILKGSGEKIEEIVTQLNLQSSKQLYLNHATTIIVGEEVARNGMKEISEFVIKRLNKNSKINLFVAKEQEASNILKNISTSDLDSMESFISSMTSSNKFRNIISNTTYNDFIRNYLDEGINPTILSIKIKEDAKENENKLPSINFESLGIFLDDKLIGWADADTSKTINIINNKINETTIRTSCNDEYVFYTLKDIYSIINVSIYNKTPKISVQINANHQLDEIYCGLKKNNEKVLNDLKNKLEQSLKEIIDKGIYEIQKKYKSDVFGFGRAIHNKKPDYWSSVKDIWDSAIFPNVEINTRVTINLKN